MRSLLLAGSLLLVSCSSPTDDASNRPDSHSSADAATKDASSQDQGVPDLGVDTGHDVGSDSPPDALLPDVTLDVGSDSPSDAPVDTGADTGQDAGIEAGPPPLSCTVYGQQGSEPGDPQLCGTGYFKYAHKCNSVPAPQCVEKSPGVWCCGSPLCVPVSYKWCPDPWTKSFVCHFEAKIPSGCVAPGGPNSAPICCP